MENQRIQSFTLKKGVKKLSGTTYIINYQDAPLGQGQFGKVMKAYDLNRKQLDLAVKIIPKNKLKNMQISIEKEKSVLEKLPYCINLVNYQKFCLESNNNYYFVMEYCNGGSLQDLLFKDFKILSEQEIIKFLVQFLNGYKELLKNNIIHRDMKPQNIMIHNDTYKICDFGQSKIIENFDVEHLQYSTMNSPFYQFENLMQDSQLTKDTDVFSLGVILFQMLYVSPNLKDCQTQLNKQQNKNVQIHPLIDMNKIYQEKEEKIFFKFKNSLKNLEQHDAFQYLDSYIQSSKIKRSNIMIDLLKSMLDINQKKRITFDQLFQHPLLKEHLNKIDNKQYLINNYIDLLSYDSLSPPKEEELKNEDYQDLQDSKILNLEELKKCLIQQKLEICENIKQELNIDCPQLQYFQEKYNYLQLQMAQVQQKENENKDIIMDDVQQQIQNDQLKNKELEDSQLQDLEIIIKLSESRQNKQKAIQKIEDILQYFRQIYMSYKKIASQLIKSYHIVKSTSQLTQTNFTNLFDNTVLLSLLIIKDEIQNLKNSFKSKLDQFFNLGDPKQQLEDIIIITDEEVEIYQKSDEKKIFFKILENDLYEIQDLLNNLMQQNQFKSIQQSYQQIASSIVVVKEQFKEFIFKLIKQGIEEFGFLEQNNYFEFQKTLLYLTEAYKHEINNQLYYKQDKFSSIQLQFRLEQIEISNSKSLDLLNFCEQNNISIIAQTD
ncbi:kinase domain protein (macronuclear) [Tetrahymena thermophila SB210]|uniref:Kinase domain protein n=1 Tax=Tetrahymena thermophila (strain SB210) TaxID=312017 RepID=I7LUN9_TETTS|nr:kinase domain protein [Tetrahymena thermophila SB210]EAR95611.1 kinase domain protein [Tetrahymena thermophila SB210]|eukprot:XP_001015856.1 kinase domain protein [Tetrahymena thermophila SB210]